MQVEAFYPRYGSLLELLPDDRHAGLRALHAETLDEYTRWVRAIRPQAAAEPASDGRSISLVVGHIAAWDRFLIQAAGEILSGVEWPGFMDLRGFLGEDGQRRDFESIDAFNAFHARHQCALDWAVIQSVALDRAQAAAALFSAPGLLTAERLERTRPTEWGLPGGKRLRAPVGWLIWMIVLEHESVEHARDLTRAAAG